VFRNQTEYGRFSRTYSNRLFNNWLEEIAAFAGHVKNCGFSAFFP
jgi:hypothetical protein